MPILEFSGPLSPVCMFISELSSVAMASGKAIATLLLFDNDGRFEDEEEEV